MRFEETGVPFPLVILPPPPPLLAWEKREPNAGQPIREPPREKALLAYTSRVVGGEEKVPDQKIHDKVVIKGQVFVRGSHCCFAKCT